MTHLRTSVAVRTLSDELLAGLQSLFGPIDAETAFAIAQSGEWVSLKSGELLFRQGDPGDSVYFIISGRLRAVQRDAKGGDRIVGEAGRGESVGEMAFFTGDPRSATLCAVRDCVLLAFSREAFETIVASQPQVTTGIVRVLIDRMQRSMRPTAPARISNVALVPLHRDFALRRFAERLTATLSTHGNVLHLNSQRVDDVLMPGAAQIAATDERGPWLGAWLDEREAEHRFVVYEADAEATEWTKRCLRQADRIVFVASAAADPGMSPMERALTEADDGQNVDHTLVLVHRRGTRLPAGTRRWLADRHLKDHVHLRGDGEAEVARLARVLAGAAVGFVLGGGGARGLAHIRVIRALHDAGVPIDMVGGTSAGAFIGALCAMGWDPAEMLAANRRIWLEVKPHRSFTLPIVSLLANRKAMACARMACKDADIEDCWFNYFCISSSLTTAEMIVHRTGPLAEATVASHTLAVVAPPVTDGEHLLDGTRQ